MQRAGVQTITSRICVLAVLFLVAATGRSDATSSRADCPIPPAFDPGIGGLYFCSPAEGERYLIAHARRAHTEQGLTEDIWANFRGIFDNRVWIDVGMHEAIDASLPAWDALASLIQWLRSIKAGNHEALEAFLAPLEINTTFTAADVALRQQLLEQLRATTGMPHDMPLHVVLYHVHLMPPAALQGRSQIPLSPMISLPSHEDLLLSPRLTTLAAHSESKVAVPAGVWTYAMDEAQAAQFAATHDDGPVNDPFTAKFSRAYRRFVQREYVKQGLSDPATLSPQRIDQYIQALRPTGAILHFAFAADWDRVRSAAPPE